MKGETYNFPELRDGLAARGHRFRREWIWNASSTGMRSTARIW
jgi:hypothetical protein